MKTRLHLARTFIEAVDGGSIASAAKALEITRSSASKNIMQLEELLDIQLLNRSTRKISMTQAGALYYQAVKASLEKIEAVESEISTFKIETSGVLHIDSSIIFGRKVISRLLPGFLSKYPKITVDLKLTDEISDIVSDNVDIFFRTGNVKDQDVVAIKIDDICYRTVVSPNYSKQYGVPANVDDIAEHNCINFKFPDTGAPFKWRFKTDSGKMAKLFSGNFISSDIEEIRKLTLNGLGIAQLPDQLVSDDISSGKLIELFEDTVYTTNRLYMCYSHKKRNNLNVKAFKEYLIEYK